MIHKVLIFQFFGFITNLLVVQVLFLFLFAVKDEQTFFIGPERFIRILPVDLLEDVSHKDSAVNNRRVRVLQNITLFVPFQNYNR